MGMIGIFQNKKKHVGPSAAVKVGDAIIVNQIVMGVMDTVAKSMAQMGTVQQRL